MSPSPRRLPDLKKKQLSLDSATSPVVVQPLTNNNPIVPALYDTPVMVSEAKIELSNGGDGGKFENISDNGSEISDEGYRSLGLIQANHQNNNAKRSSLISQTSTEDAEINGKFSFSSFNLQDL